VLVSLPPSFFEAITKVSPMGIVNLADAERPFSAPLGWAGQQSKAAYRSPFAFPLSKSLELRDPNPVYSLSDRDLGVFVVANIAPENSSAALPAHSIAGTPTRADSSSNRRCAPCLPLARLTRRAPGQSLSARHIFHPWGSQDIRDVFRPNHLVLHRPCPSCGPTNVAHL